MPIGPAKSVLGSLTANQNPCSGRNSSGTFVVATAVEADDEERHIGQAVAREIVSECKTDSEIDERVVLIVWEGCQAWICAAPVCWNRTSALIATVLIGM